MSSSLTAILISAMPLLVAVLALRFASHERATPTRVVGLVVGLTGVVLLMGIDVAGRPGELLGAGCILAATLCYACSTMIVNRQLADLPPIGPVAGGLALSTVALAPFALLSRPTAVPSGATVVSLALLGVLCTAAALIVYVFLIAEAGPSRASVITYVNPAVAVVLGLVVLGEPVTFATAAELLLIVAGSWLSTDGRLPPGLGRHLRAVTTGALGLRGRLLRFGLAVPAMLALLASCAPGGSAAPSRPATSPPSPRPSAPIARATVPPIVYAAIGASETVGVGAEDPGSQAWPVVFLRTALPPTAVFHNFGTSGQTVRGALTAELPAALSVQPSLVTVWLNVNDITAGVAAADYEARLGELVHALRRGGAARVLLANTPYLDRLPRYLACLARTQSCPFAGSPPPPAALNAQVDDYNAAIARVGQREGATLVDLHEAGEVPDIHPDWVGVDGFHPSARGYAAIAARFAAALTA